MMCDPIGGDIRSDHCNSMEKFENTNVEDIKPFCEEINIIKTEVTGENGVESEDVKPFTMSECFQSVTDEYPGIFPYEQTLKRDGYEQHIVWCKEENDVGLSKEDIDVKSEKKFVCDRCSYVTNAKSHFQRHTLVHEGKKPFKCETCGNSFRQKGDLKKHARTHDDKRQREVCCPHCNKTYYTNIALQRHFDIQHAYKKYECGLCDFKTSYKYFLKRHELIKHSDGDKLYKCMYCEHSTHYKMFLENHEPAHSNTTLLECTYNNVKSEEQSVSSKEKSCDCDPCQFETAYKDSMRRHILATHSIKAKRHTCTICTYSTHFERYLRRHMAIHASKETPDRYKCEYCHYTTHRKPNLKKHTRNHTNEKIFKCTYINCKCDRVGEKPCECEACDYQTPRKTALKCHILTKHSGKATYTCTYCDYSAHLKEYLKKHFLRKHAKSVLSENS